MGTTDNTSLVGKQVKIVCTEKDHAGNEKTKVIYGLLTEEGEFTLHVRDQYGQIVVVGKRNLVIMTERRESK